MSPIVKRILSTLAAFAVAFVIVLMTETLANQLSPLPETLDLTNRDAIQNALDTGQIPILNLGLVFAGWLIASYTGGTFAARLSGERGPAILFAVIITAATFLNLMSMPHPLWMWIGGVLGVPLVALGAAGESITLRTR